jgi:hypothetical protein
MNYGSRDFIYFYFYFLLWLARVVPGAEFISSIAKGWNIRFDAQTLITRRKAAGHPSITAPSSSGNTRLPSHSRISSDFPGPSTQADTR